MNYSWSRLFWGTFIIINLSMMGIHPLAAAFVIGILYGLTDLAEERRNQ
tara:strand:- start:796 stop:942 length:147 start_codon:yes stop_codon:yes gene_type:complete